MWERDVNRFVPEDPKVADIVQETLLALKSLGNDIKAGFEHFQEEAEYRFDKELGKSLAKHPELYAELKRTGKQIRKTFKVFLDGLNDE